MMLGRARGLNKMRDTHLRRQVIDAALPAPPTAQARALTDSHRDRNAAELSLAMWFEV